MLSIVRYGKTLNAIRRPVRSIPMATSSPNRRSYSGINGQSFETVVNEIRRVRDDIRGLRSTFDANWNDCDVIKYDFESSNNALNNSMRELQNMTSEVSTLRSFLRSNTDDLEAFRDKLEKRMTMLENNTGIRCDEIMSEIREYNTPFDSDVIEQPQGVDFSIEH